MVWWVRHISGALAALVLGCFGLVSCSCQQTGEDLCDDTSLAQIAQLKLFVYGSERRACDTQMDVLESESMALVILTVHVPITAVWVISPSTLLSLWVAGRKCLSLDMALGLHWKDWLDWSEISFIWTAWCPMLVLQRWIFAKWVVFIKEVH